MVTLSWQKPSVSRRRAVPLLVRHIILLFDFIAFQFQIAPPVAQQVKDPPAVQEMQEIWVWSLGQEGPLQKEWQPTPVFLPGEPHGQRSQLLT